MIGIQDRLRLMVMETTDLMSRGECKEALISRRETWELRTLLARRTIALAPDSASPI